MRRRDNHLHLHGAENSNGVTLLDLTVVLDPNLDNNTAHGRTDLARISGVGLEAGNVLDRSLLVVDGDLADFTVHLKEDFALASLVGQGTNSEEFEDEGLALLNLDVELLVDLGLAEEVLCGEDGKVAILLNKLLVVREHLGVHVVRSNVALRNCAVLGLDVLLDLGQVDGRKRLAGALGELAALAAEGLGAERLGESAVGLAHETLKEVEDGAGEVEGLGLLNDVVVGKLVRDHELGEISDDLGGRGNLDDIAKEVVGLGVSLLGLGPLGAEAELRGLEDEVGQLTTWDLVDVNLGVGTSKASLEARVLEAELLPVLVDGANVLDVEASLVVGALQRGHERTNAGLRSHAGQAVSCSIDSISASSSAGSHGGNTSTSRVVGVDVDRKVGVLLADAANEEGSSLGLENTSHILDTKDVDAELNNLVDEREVVLQVVLLLGVQHVARVADGALNDTSSLLGRIDTESKLVDVVQGIKDTENVDTVLLGVLAEVVDGIVGEPVEISKIHTILGEKHTKSTQHR